MRCGIVTRLGAASVCSVRLRAVGSAMAVYSLAVWWCPYLTCSIPRVLSDQRRARLVSVGARAREVVVRGRRPPCP